MRALLLALALAGCVTMPAARSSSLERTAAATERAFAAADRLLPLLPQRDRDRARSIMAAISVALDLARVASATERARQLEAVSAGVDDLAVVAAGDRSNR